MLFEHRNLTNKIKNMKLLIKLLLVIIIAFSGSDLIAQKLTRAEKKALKKELRRYKKNLPAYKSLKENQEEKLDELYGKVNSAEAEVSELRSKLSACETEKSDCLAKQYSLETQIAELKAKPIRPGISTIPDKGVGYKVQMGYYRFFNINEYFESPKIMHYEAIDGGNKYMVGYFTDPQKALDFRDDIVRLGIKDAFVVKYVDGIRTTEEVKR